MNDCASVLMRIDITLIVIIAWRLLLCHRLHSSQTLSSATFLLDLHNTDHHTALVEQSARH